MSSDKHFVAAVVDALSSGYCPTDRTAFLAMLFVLVGGFCLAGILLARLSHTARVAGIVLIVFALGGALLDLFGLSGCRGHIEAGLTWDRPW